MVLRQRLLMLMLILLVVLLLMQLLNELRLLLHQNVALEQACQGCDWYNTEPSCCLSRVGWLLLLLLTHKQSLGASR